jgi:DDB1- and CUL4-associated factor 5
VYSINDSYPIAVCTAARRPTGEPVTPTERNYGTSCTIKHVSFGGPPSSSPLPYSDPKTASSDTDQYIATGSDDFRGYAWHIPSTSYLLSERQEVEAHEDHPTGKFGYKCSAIDTLYVPAHLDKPAWRLGGHQSIVNTARWHPVLPRIATCGIESKVVLHDCANVLQGAEEVHSDKVRKRRVRIGSVMTGETSEEISDDEDKSTIFYFDQYVLSIDFVSFDPLLH